MSKITLEPNASGTGTFSIVSPNSNTNRTLNLPDESGVLFSDGSGVPGSAVTGQIDSSNMPAGSVIQTEQTIFTTPIGFNNNQTNRVEIPGFDVGITPISASNEILVTAHLAIGYSNTPEWSWYISREVSGGGTTDFLGAADQVGNRMRGYHGGPRDSGASGHTTEIESYSNSILDAPGTTSAIVYQVCFQNLWSNANFYYINRSDQDSNNGYITRGTSTITVMEIVR